MIYYINNKFVDDNKDQRLPCEIDRTWTALPTGENEDNGSIDMGTYNYCPSDVSLSGHNDLDVEPYDRWKIRLKIGLRRVSKNIKTKKYNKRNENVNTIQEHMMMGKKTI